MRTIRVERVLVRETTRCYVSGVSLVSRSNCGPAAGEMKLCAIQGCNRPIVARGLCRRCYNQRWAQGALGDTPRVETRPEEQLSQHFDVRLKAAEGASLTRLARVTGRTLASVLREATLEYLERHLGNGATKDESGNPGNSLAPG